MMIFSDRIAGLVSRISYLKKDINISKFIHSIIQSIIRDSIIRVFELN